MKEYELLRKNFSDTGNFGRSPVASQGLPVASVVLNGTKGSLYFLG